MALFSGCDRIDRSLNILEDAVWSLESADANWRRTLEETRDELLGEGRRELAADVDRILQRTVATTGSQIQCLMDSAGDRVAFNLRRVITGLKNQEPPEFAPHFCSTVPDAIDMSLSAAQRKSIAFYGYDLDNFERDSRLEVFLVSADGSETDITGALSYPNHYTWSLNIGQEYVSTTKPHRRIEVRWPDRSPYSVNFLQRQTDTTTISVDIGEQSLTPAYKKHPDFKQGDRNFDGHGPSVGVLAKIRPHWDEDIGKRVLQVYVTMSALEWENGKAKGDYTYAQGSTGWLTAWTPPDGTTLLDVVSDRETRHDYVDDDQAQDEFPFTAGELVKRFICTGDTSGDEAGTDTGVVVQFNRVQVRIRREI